VSDELHIEVQEPWADDDSSAEAVAADAAALQGEAGEAPAAPAPDPLTEAEAQRDEYLLGWQRTQADFDNFRKRAQRDQQAFAARAAERLVTKLLPVLDDLERALEAAERHEEAKLEEGVRLVHRELRDTLAKEGLVEIDTGGAFDPHVHEALLAQPSEEDEGTVIEVVQKGYRLGDRVLRAARVVVAGPQEETPGGDERHQ
jgi:molecular chaperone GrpE